MNNVYTVNVIFDGEQCALRAFATRSGAVTFVHELINDHFDDLVQDLNVPENEDAAEDVLHTEVLRGEATEALVAWSVAHDADTLMVSLGLGHGLILTELELQE